MRKTCLTALLAVAAFATAAESITWPRAPAGAIVAVASLAKLSGMKTSGTGTVSLILPRPDKGNGTITVKLSGSMKNVTMAHIYSGNATSKAVAYDLLPRLASASPVPLDPPVSYSGSFSWSTPFTVDRFQALSNGSWVELLDWLQAGKLHAYVHTAAHPAGELKGALKCREPCAWPVCVSATGSC